MLKSGFAVLVGRSNVGKSTLLNNLIGSKVAITTPKAQTTRHAIHGIFTDDEKGQIVFVDTPGLLQKRDALTKRLLHILKDSLEDIDVILYVVDATSTRSTQKKRTPLISIVTGQRTSMPSLKFRRFAEPIWKNSARPFLISFLKVNSFIRRGKLRTYQMKN